MNTQVETIETLATNDHDDELFDYDGCEEFLNKKMKGRGPKKNTLQDWVATQRVAIPYIKLGHFVRFRRSSLLRWIAGLERNV
jgi:hypothetical protein